MVTSLSGNVTAQALLEQADNWGAIRVDADTGLWSVFIKHTRTGAVSSVPTEALRNNAYMLWQDAAAAYAKSCETKVADEGILVG